MEFKQIFTPGLAICSYIIGGKSACIVVDPVREVDQYLEIARSIGLPIKGIIETHLHADFVSGHVELAEKTGAVIYISEKAKARYPHYAVADEEIITFDSLHIRMIETPGHTPDCAVFVVSDLERGEEPILAFTGDTLLVGDAGRPDLFPEIKKELASSLYKSLRRLESLGDQIEVYPAHGAGSLCGKALSSKLSSTMGTEKRYNHAFNMHPEEAFIEAFLEGMPEAPDHFSRCTELNRKGPLITSSLVKPAPFQPEEILEFARLGHVVVDTRDQLSFGGAHIPGAYGLSINGLKGNFSLYAGWVLPPDNPLILVLDSMGDMETVLKGLQRVGLDNAAGYLEGGMAAYAESGQLTGNLESISVMEMKERFDRQELLLVDTRLKSEWDAGHIQGSVHCPTAYIRKRYAEWMGDKPVAFICSTGNRSLLASSIMLKLSGMKNVINVIGGMTAWKKAGFPVVK